MPRALIVGGGVAGTVAALALKQAGWDPVIYEAYEHSAGLNQGVFLTLAVNGLDALAAVDAAETVKELGFPTGNIRFTSGSGKALGAMAIGPTLADGTVTRTLRRSELYGALYDLARSRGVQIEHSKRLIAAESRRNGIQATFADGSTASGEVLIGADGLRSATRGQIDPSAPAPRYTGMGNVGGFARPEPRSAEAHGGDYQMMWGRRCFFGYTVSPDGEVWWFANPPSRKELSDEQLRATDTEAIKAHLLELFADDRGPAREIIAATKGSILLGNQYDMPRVSNWHRGRLVLIGDAAHAVSPSTGQGVSLACEDAVVLAQCLRDLPQLEQAFAEYESRRRERVERVVAWGAKMGGTKTTGPLMRLMRDAVLPRILAKGSTREAMEKQSWMFEHHIEWDDPAVANVEPSIKTLA
jgi:2-polyprenyl-6-methoxyphenol hydroxylase-like FAD-dependent oxidoreductase